MESYKLCPLCKLDYENDLGYMFGLCAKFKCAWWAGECSIVNIARNLASCVPSTWVDGAK